jgi:putative transposase
MAYKASAHAVYDLQYHMVWTPKYRKAVLVGEIAQAVQALLYRIAEAYDMEIDTMEVMEDHVHLFLSAPPRYAPARIVHILTSLSARELCARFPRLRRQLWGGQLWEDGYFVRSVGDAVTAEIIRRSIRYQKSPQSVQLSLFDERP